MTDPDNTSAEILMRAGEIGRKSGLRYVYAGNLPGKVGDLENTRCPHCRQLLIERYGYLIMGYHLTSNGCCPSCGTRVPGRWGSRVSGTDHRPSVCAACAFQFVLDSRSFGIDVTSRRARGRCQRLRCTSSNPLRGPQVSGRTNPTQNAMIQ